MFYHWGALNSELTKCVDLADKYGDDFFAKIDGVTNALDNVSAREWEIKGWLKRIVTDAIFCRSIHGSTMCFLPKAFARIRYSRDQGQHAGCHSILDRILLLVSGPT